MNIQRDDVGIVPYGGKLYTVANNYPAVGTGVLDCPFMVNFTRTVWNEGPYNYHCKHPYKLQFEYPNCTAEENFSRLLLCSEGAVRVYCPERKVVRCGNLTSRQITIYKNFLFVMYFRVDTYVVK